MEPNSLISGDTSTLSTATYSVERTLPATHLELSTLSNMSILDNNNDLARFEECPAEVMTCQVQKYLFLVLAPVLVLVAGVGNGLGLAVMTRKSLRNSATAVFISSLAVSDTIAVWTGLSRHFIKKLTRVCHIHVNMHFLG